MKCRDFRREPELPALGTPDSRRDFRRAKMRKRLNHEVSGLPEGARTSSIQNSRLPSGLSMGEDVQAGCG